MNCTSLLYIFAFVGCFFILVMSNTGNNEKEAKKNASQSLDADQLANLRTSVNSAHQASFDLASSLKSGALKEQGKAALAKADEHKSDPKENPRAGDHGVSSSHGGAKDHIRDMFHQASHPRPPPPAPPSPMEPENTDPDANTHLKSSPAALEDPTATSTAGPPLPPRPTSTAAATTAATTTTASASASASDTDTDAPMRYAEDDSAPRRRSVPSPSCASEQIRLEWAERQEDRNRAKYNLPPARGHSHAHGEAPDLHKAAHRHEESKDAVMDTISQWESGAVHQH
jgi:hypothetical protein